MSFCFNLELFFGGKMCHGVSRLPVWGRPRESGHGCASPQSLEVGCTESLPVYTGEFLMTSFSHFCICLNTQGE